MGAPLLIGMALGGLIALTPFGLAAALVYYWIRGR